MWFSLFTFFLSLFQMQVGQSSISTVVDLDKENKLLKEEVKSLTTQLHAASDLVRRVQKGEHGRGKRKASDEYSDRHLRRLKKDRVCASLASLSWLEKEGLKPVKVEVMNSKTKKIETINSGGKCLI